MTLYNPNIPQASDNLSVSQGQIQNNFSQANSVMAVNHYPFDFATTSLEGKHKFCSFVDQVSTDPSTATGEMALYNKGDELFYRLQTSGTVVQLTGPALNAGSGYTTLPGGVLMQWGTGVVSSGGVIITVTFPIAFSATPYSVSSTPYNNFISGTTPKVWGVVGSSITSTNAQMGVISGNTVPSNTSFSWIAIGPS